VQLHVLLVFGMSAEEIPKYYVMSQTFLKENILNRGTLVSVDINYCMFLHGLDTALYGTKREIFNPNFDNVNYPKGVRVYEPYNQLIFLFLGFINPNTFFVFEI